LVLTVHKLYVGLPTILTVALILQCCVRRLSVCTGCIVAKRCVQQQKLLLTAYGKSHMRNWLVPKMN